MFKFVHFLPKSAKIGDISTILGGFLSTVNGFPTKNVVCDESACTTEVDKNKVHDHPIISPCSNSCIAVIKVLELGTFLRFWGIFLARLKDFRPKCSQRRIRLRGRWTRIRFTSIQSYRPPPNLCVPGIKVQKSKTILRFWG